MLEHVRVETEKFLAGAQRSARKEYGQFFTESETARYMVSMFDLSHLQNRVKILDAGAGSGMLAIAMLDRLQDDTNVTFVKLTCFETDIHILPVLRKNLDWAFSQIYRFKLEISIVVENYITFNRKNNKSDDVERYDLILSNPPYKKIPRESGEAKSLPEVCRGVPNLYSLFLARSIEDLKVGGQLVYITPRSWTSGAYFEKFRRFFFNAVVLNHVHYFSKRDQVFKKDNVLQEVIIVHATKTTQPIDKMLVTSSESCSDLSTMASHETPYSKAVVGAARYLFLIPDLESEEVVDTIHQFRFTLPLLGMRMKTGPTVDFREGRLLRNSLNDTSIPLFDADHVKDGYINFPLGRNNEFVAKDKASLCQRNHNYLFVKRFSAPDGFRRFHCAVYLASNWPGIDYVSMDNKLNYICSENGLSRDQVFGLYAIFNSSIYNHYYCLLNGSTQINSSEINNIPMPPLSLIEEMGSLVLSKNDLSVTFCDTVLQFALLKN